MFFVEPQGNLIYKVRECFGENSSANLVAQKYNAVHCGNFDEIYSGDKLKIIVLTCETVESVD